MMTPTESANLVHKAIAAAKRDGGDLYVRFGDLPVRGRSLNHATLQSEQGTSVYLALSTSPVTRHGIDRDTFIPFGANGADYPHHYELYGNVAALVAGDVVGYGSDGEPLLRHIRYICKLRRDTESAGLYAITYAPAESVAPRLFKLWLTSALRAQLRQYADGRVARSVGEEKK
jgi:hypothetical protein